MVDANVPCYCSEEKCVIGKLGLSDEAVTIDWNYLLMNYVPVTDDYRLPVSAPSARGIFQCPHCNSPVSLKECRICSDEKPDERVGPRVSVPTDFIAEDYIIVLGKTKISIT